VTAAQAPASGHGRAASGAADPAVPLTLLTGFLGAGKTTLVNRALAGELGGSLGVLVNDFGALAIDRDLLATGKDGVLSLENGCICCSLRGDLVASVMKMLARPEAPRRLLLEASGVADPMPIVGTFLAPAFRHRLRLDGVVCVVDAEQALTVPALEDLQLRQIGFADLVVLNKTDLAGDARVAALSARIRTEFSGARLVETRHCDVPAEILFSLPTGGNGPSQVPRRTPAATHANRFETFSFQPTGAFSADALHELARALPPTMYRVKGVVRLKGRRGAPDRCGVLQIVGRRTDLVAQAPWAPADAASRLVFIGEAGGACAASLERLVNDCLWDGS
jgi:G3E family GTPase